MLHHLSLNGGSLLDWAPVLREGWLFVDLFFVLSGYVIASVHCESEATPAAARGFLIRRFFRLYPLHLVTLSGALLLDIFNGTARLPGYAATVAMNLTMTQAWGLVPGSVLNGPSWSVSTEWGAYLVFALICLMTPMPRRRLQLLGAIGMLSLVSLIVWRDASLDGDLLFRLPRCLMSFALGASTWAWCRNRRPLAQRTAGRLQLVLAGAMFLLLGVAGRQPHLTLLMPLLSAAMIVAMVRDDGSTVRRLLERRVPQWLGRCSYSIYLLHMPVFKAMIVATPGGWPSSSATATLWIITALIVLFGFSTVTYAFLEKPWRAFGRRLANAQPSLTQAAAA